MIKLLVLLALITGCTDRTPAAKAINDQRTMFYTDCVKKGFPTNKCQKYAETLFPLKKAKYPQTKG